MLRSGVPLENTTLLFQKENWGRAYYSGSDVNEFLEFNADDSSGSLLGGARKIDVSGSATGVSGLHIRETNVAEIPDSGRTLSSLHHNEPPEDDFMYNSVTSTSAVERILVNASNTSPAEPDMNRLESRLSVTSL